MTEEKEQADSETIVRRIQAGDRAAEDLLFKNFERGIRFQLLRACRCPSDAEDLFQETFRLAIEKIRAGDPKEPNRLGSYLAGIARFQAIGHYRKKKPDQQIQLDDMLPDEGTSPIDEVIAKEKSKKIHATMAELPVQRDRELLLRFYIGGEEKADLCKELELSDKHFNRVLSRAKKRFKNLWEKTSFRLKQSKSI